MRARFNLVASLSRYGFNWEFYNRFVGFSCTLLSPIHVIKNPLQWLTLIDRYQVTTSGGPNFAYALCTKLLKSGCNSFDLSSWQVAFCGAEPLRADPLQQFCERTQRFNFNSQAFYPCYGLAEHTLIATGRRYLTGMSTVLSQDPDYPQLYVSCGEAIAGHEVVIVDPASKKVCAGEVGEVGYKARGDARIRNKPELTKTTFHAYIEDGGGHF